MVVLTCKNGSACILPIRTDILTFDVGFIAIYSHSANISNKMNVTCRVAGGGSGMDISQNSQPEFYSTVIPKTDFTYFPTIVIGV